jgi:predicted AlkP superfamily pyrophosphatase or phosphodiesterase
MQKTYKLLVLTLLTLIFFLGSTKLESELNAETSATRKNVKLVLMIVIDQMPSEFLVRFAPHLKFGLKKILDESKQFINTKHDHAITETCPGHAAIATGTHPARSGIVSNSWFNREKNIVQYCVNDPAFTLSPRNLLVSALPDWIKKKSPESKVFSISAKDRSAIMLGGQMANAAFWYNQLSGKFESSAYYNKDYTNILNTAPDASKYFGRSWAATVTDEHLLKSAKIKLIDQELQNDHLPRIIGNVGTAPTEDFFTHLYHTPFVDNLTGEFTELLLTSEKLGTSKHIDYLAISFSALDTVGHIYGPNSPEVFDAVLRLDRTLMQLLDAVDRQVGLNNTLINLSSDHGIIAFPEYDKTKIRITHDQVLCEQEIFQKVQKKFRGKYKFVFDQYLSKPSSSVVEQFVVNELEKCTHIEKVWLPKDFIANSDHYAKLYKNSFNRKRSPSFLKQVKGSILPKPISGTEHGSPYDYDRSVPWLVRLPKGFDQVIQPQEKTIKLTAQTIDIAPTLAYLLGIAIPKHVQGRAMLKVR